MFDVHTHFSAQNHNICGLIEDSKKPTSGRVTPKKLEVKGNFDHWITERELSFRMHYHNNIPELFIFA